MRAREKRRGNKAGVGWNWGIEARARLSCLWSPMWKCGGVLACDWLVGEAQRTRGQCRNGAFCVDASTGQTGWGQGEGRSDPAAPGRASSRRERATKQAERGGLRLPVSLSPLGSHLTHALTHSLTHTTQLPPYKATRLRTQSSGCHKPGHAVSPGVLYVSPENKTISSSKGQGSLLTRLQGRVAGSG